MTLLEKQQKFSMMVALLLQYIIGNGYQVTLGDAYRDPRVTYGHPQSLHRQRLAIDLNIFRNGIWLKDGSQFEDIGNYWESIGGSWGGRFSDGNHFSLAHDGMR